MFLRSRKKIASSITVDTTDEFKMMEVVLGTIIYDKINTTERCPF